MIGLTKLLAKEIFSLSTLLFVVVPFMMQMHSEPAAANEKINGFQESAYSVVGMLDGGFNQLGTHMEERSSMTLPGMSDSDVLGAFASGGSSSRSGIHAGHGPIFLP